ncbi:MAG TPA: GTPase ObgE [Candidatus Krumholzibacteria bacterium]|nr:GTPase ObgE [Candidatus Krumholzibacteria bacterium]
MFIDHVIVDVRAGDGGDGCVSFRHEKFAPQGGPNGGDGGHGGDVVVQASRGVSTLIDLHYHRHYRAERGGHGKGKSQTGRDGADAVIVVPPGTVVRDAESGETVAELLADGDRVVVAKGGRSGFGNEHYKTARNRTPRQFTYGGDGEARRLEITLKLIADVGLVGEPNAGKSTLISSVSAAHPKIADYPFTTTTPVLGIVRFDEHAAFVMVDIPGLIEGAHHGRGMGKEFLRHVERCRVLLYMVDVIHPDPAAAYQMLRSELMHYDPVLLERRSILALTKCDVLPGGVKGVDPALLRLHECTVPISAVSGEGLDVLLKEIGRRLRE